ncbi:MAG TPA: hypothetical protein VNE62_00220 [Actinomycetota bacterium]|nr:hypothetical protein [Actinomycetota bacterium]
MRVQGRVFSRAGLAVALSALISGLMVTSAPIAGAQAPNDGLSIEKQCSNPEGGDTTAAGLEFGCVITVTTETPGDPDGGDNFNNVTVTDQVSPGSAVEFVEVVTFAANPDGDEVTCEVTNEENETVVCDLNTETATNPDPGENETVFGLIYRVRTDFNCAETEEDPDVFTNTATVEGTEQSPEAGENATSTDTATGTIKVVCRADLALDKECENATVNRGTGPEGRIRVAPGDRIRCTLTVENFGPSGAFGVVLTDNIPESAEIDPASIQSDPEPPEGFACTVQDNPDEELRCEDPFVDVGDVNTVTYEAVVGVNGVGPGRRFSNQANVTSDTPERAVNEPNDDSEDFETPPCDRNLDARGARRGVSITGTRGNDVICGTRFGDSINARSGNDIVYGFGGNDAINGSYGNDALLGGSGNDAIRGHYGNDEIFGESGNDALAGNSGFDRIDGGTGRDACRGERKVRC